jgi:hypothetical protein
MARLRMGYSTAMLELVVIVVKPLKVVNGAADGG